MPAYEFPVYPGPIRLGALPVPLFGAIAPVEPGFQFRVRQLLPQRQGQADGGKVPYRLAQRLGHHARPPRNLVLRNRGTHQTQNFAHMAHANSPRRHQTPPRQRPKRRS